MLQFTLTDLEVMLSALGGERVFVNTLITTETDDIIIGDLINQISHIEDLSRRIRESYNERIRLITI